MLQDALHHFGNLLVFYEVGSQGLQLKRKASVSGLDLRLLTSSATGDTNSTLNWKSSYVGPHKQDV